MGHAFHSFAEAHELSFIDALYYSGGAGAVLGFGDIVPVTAAFKALAIVEAGLGFALITGVITYLLEVTSAVTERNILAVRVFEETGRAGRGASFVARALEAGQLPELAGRVSSLVVSLQRLQGRAHQFPVVDLYYRSRNPQHDPEAMLRALGEMAIAVHIAAQTEEGRCLRLVAEDLDNVLTEFMELIAERCLPAHVRWTLCHPEPAGADRLKARKIRRSLWPRLAGSAGGEATAEERAMLNLCFRLRVLLRELDGLTGWTIDQPGSAMGAAKEGVGEADGEATPK